MESIIHSKSNRHYLVSTIGAALSTVEMISYHQGYNQR